MTDKRTDSIEELRLYSLAEAEDIVGLTAQTLKRHIKAGKLEAVKVGNRWKVTKDSLEKYIKGE